MGSGLPEEKRGGKKKIFLIQFQFLLVMFSVFTLEIHCTGIVAESFSLTLHPFMCINFDSDKRFNGLPVLL